MKYKRFLATKTHNKPQKINHFIVLLIPPMARLVAAPLRRGGVVIFIGFYDITVEIRSGGHKIEIRRAQGDLTLDQVVCIGSEGGNGIRGGCGFSIHIDFIDINPP